MAKSITGTILCGGLLAAMAAQAASAGTDENGVGSLEVCYQSSIPIAMKGSPTLNLDLRIESVPDKVVNGEAVVTTAEGRKALTTTASGVWYYMCTMKSCSVRFDFKGENADILRGMLVVPNWGHQGTLIYRYQAEDAQPIEFEQGAIPVDCSR